LPGYATFHWWCERHVNLHEEDTPGSRLRRADAVETGV